MRTSPFNKQDSDKDVHFLVKKTKEAATNAHDTVTSIFPISGDVPHSIRLYSALFYLAAVIAVFVYLLWTGYESTINTQFLSPYLGNHAPPDSNCHLIPISYTGKFLVSDDGYWEGAKKFSYNRATYDFDVTAYSVTSNDFKINMNTVYNGLAELGTLAETQSLSENLHLWMSAVFVNNGSNAQRFTLTGDPLVIFDRDHTDASVSSIKGNCNVSSTSSFDKSNGMMSVSFVYADFIAEPLCMAAMNPIHLGYNMMTKPKLFTISYDIRTLITGLAVNQGILKTDQLEEIVSYRQDIIASGLPVKVKWYYDPRYAGMAPLRCSSISGAVEYCTLRLNEVVMFPLFRHVGANTTKPELCDCTTLTEADLSSPSHNCNVFRFLSGFMFFPGVYATSAAYVIDLVVHKYHNNYPILNAGAHSALFAASVYGQNSPLAAELNSKIALAAAYDFCTVDTRSCSIISFASYDLTATSWALNQHYTLLQNGACVNSIAPTTEAWARVVNTPYGELVQSYQQCKNDKYQTMMNQAGIAVGNLQVFAPICVIFLMLVTYLHKWWNKVPLDESYTKAEKDSALDAFSMSLLLARDEKLKTHSFRGNNSIIALIAEELGEHTYLSAVSHKSHATNYSMSNLSTHSLNSMTGSESPTRKIYDKLSGRARSGSTSSQCQVVPIDDQIELKITTVYHTDRGRDGQDKNILQVVDLEGGGRKSFALVGSFSAPEGDSDRY